MPAQPQSGTARRLGSTCPRYEICLQWLVVGTKCKGMPRSLAYRPECCLSLWPAFFSLWGKIVVCMGGAQYRLQCYRLPRRLCLHLFFLQCTLLRGPLQALTTRLARPSCFQPASRALHLSAFARNQENQCKSHLID